MIKSQDELLKILKSTFNQDENECIEFKEAKNNFDFDKLGKYFSALSNEATLKRKQYGWLIFGIADKTHEIVGTNFRNQGNLEDLKREIPEHTKGITFIEIYELDVENKRVIMFQIPAAYGLPTLWKGYGYSRNFESLVALSEIKSEQIKNYGRTDWSATVIEKATMDHLDKEAILLAREQYKIKNKNKYLYNEIDSMTDKEFLNKSGLTLDGKITYTTLLLLGKEDSDFFWNHNPEIMWQLQDLNSEVEDYEIFTIPFIKTVDKVLSKIRNLTYRYLVGQMTLFTNEVQQYEPYVLRELLNNCIAHQDYRMGGRINIIEKKDFLIFRNEGEFIPESLENVFSEGYVPPFYRNGQLAKAMVNLNMIDTAGSGIKRVFNMQRRRYFPLPDFDLSEPRRVKVTLYGKVINENYSKLLANRPTITFDEVFLLDRVQKRLMIDKEEHKQLKKAGLVEGRYPNLRISSIVASAIGKKEEYIENKEFDNKFYKEKIIQYLKAYPESTRKDINKLMFRYLPQDMREKQKDSRIRYLLNSLRKEGKIINVGTNYNSRWKIEE